MRTLRYVIVDVFTTTPLEGNPLAVFTGGDGLSDETMQALARETNLSETTFLQRAEDGGTARLRIFTPTEELPFAGHPVLGSAWVIARATPIHTIGFETGMGLIPVEIEREGGTLIGARMTQPDPLIGPADVDVEALSRALGTPLIGEPMRAANGITHLLCPVADVGAANAYWSCAGCIAEVDGCGEASVHVNPFKLRGFNCKLYLYHGQILFDFR